MNEDLVAKLRSVRVRTPEEIMAGNGGYQLLTPEDTTLRTSPEWKIYWKGRGARLASMADLYEGFKAIYEMYNYGEPGKAYGLCKELKEDFMRCDWLETGTRIYYSQTHTTSQIIHNYGSTSAQKIAVEVPELSNVRICNVDSSSLEFLRALFGTRDSAKKIDEVMRYALGARRVSVSSVSISEGLNREHLPERAVVLYNISDSIRKEIMVNAQGIGSLALGISRGVRR